MTARNTIFLEPSRILPPLVSSLVEDHQVGVIVPVEEMLPVQAQKWQILQKSPVFSLGNPIHDSELKIIDAGLDFLAKGSDVIMLDCLGFHQRHRDLLQKQLDVPVLLSNVLIARLAAEHDSEQKIIDAGKELLAKGADVIMLDCLGFHQRHRDLLQKQLDVPVLLSNVLIARLAAELLV